jgi:hypothetical protein
MTDTNPINSDASSNNGNQNASYPVDIAPQQKTKGVETKRWKFLNFPSVAVLSLIVSVLSFSVATGSVYYQFFYDNSKFTADVSPINYLDLDNSSFDLRFDLFASGNRSILVQDIGVVELINYQQQPSCQEQEVTGALRTEILEGTTNGMIPHQLQDDTIMFIPELKDFQLDSITQKNHDFIITPGNAKTVLESYQVEPEYSESIKGIEYCPYFSFARMNGKTSTIICSKFSLTPSRTPEGPRQINFINGEISIVPESSSCQVVQEDI